jgi:hypothetical protein
MSDFRLPTAKEMDSLVDPRVPEPGPTIDAIAFPDTPVDANFWTSTLNGANAWTTDFRDGTTLGPYQSDHARVRCVR